MRYEIVKKRIDKAHIRGTDERLTQPGTIAIVYSQPREAVEYREYIAYLQAAGYVARDIEELELEDLEGAQGLRALRIAVNTQETPQQPGTLDDIAEVVGALMR
jgi:hypothetical protein